MNICENEIKSEEIRMKERIRKINRKNKKKMKKMIIRDKFSAKDRRMKH